MISSSIRHSNGQRLQVSNPSYLRRLIEKEGFGTERVNRGTRTFDKPFVSTTSQPVDVFSAETGLRKYSKEAAKQASPPVLADPLKEPPVLSRVIIQGPKDPEGSTGKTGILGRQNNDVEMKEVKKEAGFLERHKNDIEKLLAPLAKDGGANLPEDSSERRAEKRLASYIRQQGEAMKKATRPEMPGSVKITPESSKPSKKRRVSAQDLGSSVTATTAIKKEPERSKTDIMSMMDVSPTLTAEVDEMDLLYQFKR